MSFPEEALEKIASDEGLVRIGRLVRDEGTNIIYLQVEFSLRSDGTRSPNRNQVLRAKQRSAELGFDLHVMLTNSAHEEFEDVLKASLLLAFPEKLSNVFCSVNSKHVNVWLEPKQPLSEDLTSEMKKSASKFCESQNLSLATFESIGNALTPGKTAILTALRSIAPASPEEIRNALNKSEFLVPSLSWLKRKLDVYRKTKSVVFTGDKKYALTATSLHTLGTSKVGRTSKDVGRLLALWRSTR